MKEIAAITVFYVCTCMQSNRVYHINDSLKYVKKPVPLTDLLEVHCKRVEVDTLIYDSLNNYTDAECAIFYKGE